MNVIIMPTVKYVTAKQKFSGRIKSQGASKAWRLSLLKGDFAMVLCLLATYLLKSNCWKIKINKIQIFIQL